MAANRLSLVTLALGLVLVAQLTSGAPRCSRIKAAFSFDHGMRFIIGDQMVTVGMDNTIHYKSPVSELGFGYDITAAVPLDSHREFYLYPGTDEEGFSNFGLPSDRTRYTSNVNLRMAFTRDPFFQGIDAAMEINGELFYFGGCSYVTINEADPTDVSDLKANSDLGLPCNVDAALYSPLFGTQVVIKGDQVWMFDSDIFQGPEAIEHVFWGLLGTHHRLQILSSLIRIE